jgi:hypothetical protein
MPLLMATLLGARMSVECQANLVSYFDLGSHSFGERSFYCHSGYKGSTSLKTSHPCRLHL